MSLSSPPEARAPGPSAPALNREIYQELRRIAASRMASQSPGQTLQPTELVHEAWLRLWREEPSWQNRGHLLASATLTMRRILIDRARKKAARDRLHAPSDADVEGLAESLASEKLLRINEAILQLERVHPVHARVVVARFFAGLTAPEIAQELGIGERSVERYWALAKVWLLRWMEQPT